jgi:hypothetical protein
MAGKTLSVEAPASRELRAESVEETDVRCRVSGVEVSR